MMPAPADPTTTTRTKVPDDENARCKWRIPILTRHPRCPLQLWYDSSDALRGAYVLSAAAFVGIAVTACLMVALLLSILNLLIAAAAVGLVQYYNRFGEKTGLLGNSLVSANLTIPFIFVGTISSIISVCLSATYTYNVRIDVDYSAVSGAISFGTAYALALTEGKWRVPILTRHLGTRAIPTKPDTLATHSLLGTCVVRPTYLYRESPSDEVAPEAREYRRRD